MPLGRGIHFSPACDIDSIGRELREDGWDVFVLADRIEDKRSFFDAVESLPLDPPLSRVRDVWEALDDSLWGGLAAHPSKNVAIIWPSASKLAATDPDAYSVAIEILGGLPASLADAALTDGDPTDLAVVVSR